jgi:hypothetical protein
LSVLNLLPLLIRIRDGRGNNTSNTIGCEHVIDAECSGCGSIGLSDVVAFKVCKKFSERIVGRFGKGDSPGKEGAEYYAKRDPLNP